MAKTISVLVVGGVLAFAMWASVVISCKVMVALYNMGF
jgi:hypothetical protein